MGGSEPRRCSDAGDRTAAPDDVVVRIEPAPAAAKPTEPPARPAPLPSAVGVLELPTPTANCDLELELTLGLEGSVLAEHHDRSGAIDFHSRFPAYPVDPETFVPVQATAEFTIDERPILWFTPDGQRVVVDHTFARDLEAVDAFSLPAGASVPIGSLATEGLRLEPARWVELLLRARIAAAWAEGPAELCVDWREADGEAFDAYIMGQRSTGGGEPEPVHFLLRIDVNRAISVVGLPR